MNRAIWVKCTFEGFHNYKKAPDEVAYLRHLHRHLFKLKVYIEVYGDDREIEFHMFKKFIIDCIKSENYNNKSCEMIANDLYLIINKKYPNRDVKIELSEDGECGCEINYNKHQINPGNGTLYWSGLGGK